MMDYTPPKKRFRKLLRDIRKEAGLSQAALAAKLGELQSFVSKCESGERRMDFQETVDFCTACNVTVSRFLARLTKAAAIEEGEAAPKKSSRRKSKAKGRVSG